MPPLINWILRLGPTNPIAMRLVSSGSRQTRHLLIRSAYLAALILVLLWVLWLSTLAGSLSYKQLAAAGATSFARIAYLQIGLICLLSPVFMAGAIAQEANPKTWDILLTTPLSPTQIVLGNLLGRLFFVLALLAASLPLFALTQYFGGVPGRSIFISSLIAACAALLVGSIAIWLSISRVVGKRAVFAFYISVVTYLAITFAIDRWLISSGRGVGPTGQGVTWMTAINPFLTLHALLNPSSYVRAEPGTLSGLSSWFLGKPITTWCTGSILLSVIMMVFAAATVRLGGVAGIGAGNSGIPFYRRLLHLGAKGAEHRPPRSVWHNPIAWREAAARNSSFGRIIARWTFIGLGGVLGLGIVASYHIGKLTISEYRLALLATVVAEVLITTLVAINMSATAVSREREDGTLDLLLTTPITPKQYLAGKMRGLIAYLLPLAAVPIATLSIAGLHVLAGGLGGSASVTIAEKIGARSIEVPIILPEAGLILALTIVPFLAFCCVIGLQWSLRSKGTIGSVIASVSIVGAISVVVGLCSWQAGSQMTVIGPILTSMSPAAVIFAAVDPVHAMLATINNTTGGLGTARLALAAGAVVAGLIYLLIVHLTQMSMVRGFDMTVRKLAGQS